MISIVRARARSGLLVVLVLVLVLGLGLTTAPGCTANGDEVAPPLDQFFFPTGAVLAPDESVLFVVNANSELRWDSGSIQVVDLDRVDQVIDAWVATRTVPDACTPDPDFTETLICDETTFIRALAGVRLGNFVADLGVQDTGAGTARLVVPVRGDPSITWIDYRDEVLRCGDAIDQADTTCDDAHRLSYIHDDEAVAVLPAEPYAVHVDSVAELAIVTHPTTGVITLLDSPRAGTPMIADAIAGVFAADPTTSITGASGVTGVPGGRVYVGSRSEDRIQTLTVGRPINDAPRFLIEGSYFFLDGIGANSGGSTDTRGMTMSAAGDRLYAVNREPPSLQIIDTSLDARGAPVHETIAATDLCRQASTIAAVDLGLAGEGERVYVTCFQDGELYVIDPRGLGRVVDVISVGRGPYTVVGSPRRHKLFVTNVLEDTIAVVDVTPNVPTHDRVVLQLGESKAP